MVVFPEAGAYRPGRLECSITQIGPLWGDFGKFSFFKKQLPLRNPNFTSILPKRNVKSLDLRGALW